MKGSFITNLLKGTTKDTSYKDLHALVSKFREQIDKYLLKRKNSYT
jgi:hypothetical protein